jgi:hypothetical protein
LPRSLPTTISAETPRWATGFSETNTKPELVRLPPVKPTTVLTAGSLCTMDCNWASFCFIAWNEML